jgi:two-component system, LuxR family, sensor kinase FixL
MSLVTIIWSMIASACLTLAGFNLVIWVRNRASLANLSFTVLAIGVAALTFCELGMMRAATPAHFATVLRWGHVPTWVIVVSIVAFIRLYLDAGRPWLAWLAISLRTLALALNFVIGQNLNYRAITGLGRVSFLNDTVAMAIGVRNPWMIVGQLSLVILALFLADASLTTWRRGDHHRAVTVGGAAFFFMLFSAMQSSLVFWGILPLPIMASLSFMGLVGVMGYQLSGDTLRAAELARKLQESEADLHEVEERMRLAVESADLGIWTRDLTQNEVWATDVCRAQLGLSMKERLEFSDVLERIHPDDRDTFRSVLDYVSDGDGGYEAEYRVVLPSGGVRWISAHGRVESDATGRPVLLRGISRDITKQKEDEQEAVKLRQEIAHVGRVSMVGQLASALAHEINQPLAAILRNAEAAELFMQDKSPDLEEVKAILTDIRKDDERAGKVIYQMRGLLKRQDLNKRPISVDEILREVAALVRSDASARHIRFDVNVADSLPRVLGDVVHLEQVLLNLIVNGMDALDDVKLENRQIRVTAMLDGPKTIEIAVSDSGRGLPAEVLARVFEPFFTTKGNGLGMGLPISRTIIEAHGGRLWAENGKEGGAVFRFTLPIAEEAA